MARPGVKGLGDLRHLRREMRAVDRCSDERPDRLAVGEDELRLDVAPLDAAERTGEELGTVVMAEGQGIARLEARLDDVPKLGHVVLAIRRRDEPAVAEQNP